MNCKKCSSPNITVTPVSVSKKRGCLGALMWMVLVVLTFGFIIWIPLLIRKGSKIKSVAVCQACGYRWNV